MRDYIIMTDSCCDLSQQEVEELDLDRFCPSHLPSRAKRF